VLGVVREAVDALEAIVTRLVVGCISPFLFSEVNPARIH
jgi:hypothetical protein